jgi:hypothetical protein
MFIVAVLGLMAGRVWDAWRVQVRVDVYRTLQKDRATRCSALIQGKLLQPYGTYEGFVYPLRRLRV